MLKFRDRFTAGRLTSKQAIVGTSDWRGLSVMSAGSVSVVVSATGVVSGNVVILQPYAQPGTMIHSLATQLVVGSVGTSNFTVFAVASRGPTSDMPFAWMVMK